MDLDSLYEQIDAWEDEEFTENASFVLEQKETIANHLHATGLDQKLVNFALNHPDLLMRLVKQNLSALARLRHPDQYQSTEENDQTFSSISAAITLTHNPEKLRAEARKYTEDTHLKQITAICNQTRELSKNSKQKDGIYSFLIEQHRFAEQLRRQGPIQFEALAIDQFTTLERSIGRKMDDERIAEQTAIEDAGDLKLALDTAIETKVRELFGVLLAMFPMHQTLDERTAIITTCAQRYAKEHNNSGTLYQNLLTSSVSTYSKISDEAVCLDRAFRLWIDAGDFFSSNAQKTSQHFKKIKAAIKPISLRSYFPRVPHTLSKPIFELELALKRIQGPDAWLEFLKSNIADYQEFISTDPNTIRQHRNLLAIEEELSVLPSEISLSSEKNSIVLFPPISEYFKPNYDFLDNYFRKPGFIEVHATGPLAYCLEKIEDEERDRIGKQSISTDSEEQEKQLLAQYHIKHLNELHRTAKIQGSKYTIDLYDSVPHVFDTEGNNLGRFFGFQWHSSSGYRQGLMLRKISFDGYKHIKNTTQMTRIGLPRQLIENFTLATKDNVNFDTCFLYIIDNNNKLRGSASAVAFAALTKCPEYDE